MTKFGRRSAIASHPARFIVSGFATSIVVGTTLLSLPFATQNSRAPLVTAFFTATSATTVTGLSTVDTGTYWSGFGQGVILALIEIGGLGFMTVATLVMILISKKLGLRHILFAQTERGTLALGDLREVFKSLGIITFTTQGIIAGFLAVRFFVTYDYPLDDAIFHGVFHSVAAFNNAGFALYPDSMMRFVDDASINTVLIIAIVIGGLGFPVLHDLYANRRRLSKISFHSKITLSATTAVFVFGAIILLFLEWTNPDTFGPMSTYQKTIAGVFSSVTPRTAGFNTIDVGLMRPASLLITMVLMFIGAGAAGTSGGIKVTTFAVLGMALWAELRGDDDVDGFERRIPERTIRHALTVALLSVAVVVATTSLIMMSDNALSLEQAMFEATSAFGTVGLSTDITQHLPDLTQIWLTVVMLIGRLGPVTLGSALLLKKSPQRYHWPEESPLIG